MECPNCSRDGFTHLSRHWAGSECEYPELSIEQEEIVTGVLMGDGNYNNYGKQDRIRISMLNEKHEKDKIESYVSTYCNVDTFHWDESENRCDLVFNVDTTETLFEYMGESLPGFEYKWPN